MVQGIGGDDGIVSVFCQLLSQALREVTAVEFRQGHPCLSPFYHFAGEILTEDGTAFLIVPGSQRSRAESDVQHRFLKGTLDFF